MQAPPPFSFLSLNGDVRSFSESQQIGGLARSQPPSSAEKILKSLGKTVSGCYPADMKRI
jgi:hypothetical protein